MPTTSDDKIVKVFNEKITFNKSEKYLDGSNLEVDKNYLVPCISSGVVVFVGEKENIGNVIIIETEDNSTITYGNILNTSLKLYDYVEKGDFIGEVSDTTLYLSILKDNNYLDITSYLS